MEPIDPTQRSLVNRANIYRRWSRADAEDRRAATAPARSGFRTRFEREIDPDGTLPPEERARRTNAAIRAHMLTLSARARASRLQRRAERDAAAAATLAAELRDAADQIDAELDTRDGGDAA